MDKQDVRLLKEKVDEAIERIRFGYEQTEGKIYLAFSGGKDSTTVAELVKMAKLERDIPFVFTDTLVEFDAVRDFVFNYDYPNMVYLDPRLPFDDIIEQFGIPAINKTRADYLGCYDRNINNPNLMDIQRMKVLIQGEAINNKQGLGFRSAYALAEKHFHFLHPDRVAEYKIDNKCCTYLKIHPLYEFKLFNDIKGYYTGVRIAEGGARKNSLKDFYIWKKEYKKKELKVSPIYDWSDELREQFLEYYNVPVSIAYTKYGMDRTGCVGCPFSRNCGKDLAISKEFEPDKYDEVLNRFKLVYIDQGVKLEFDKEYMEEFYERDAINKIRREEMLAKYDSIRFKPWKFWED